MSLLHPFRDRADGRKVRYAVYGAGWIAQEDFMPGVEHTGNSVMTAIVTGDQEKAARTCQEIRRSSTSRTTHGYDALLKLGPHRRRVRGQSQFPAPRPGRQGVGGGHPCPVRKAHGPHGGRLPGDDRRQRENRRETHDRLPAALRGGDRRGAGNRALGHHRRAAAFQQRFHPADFRGKQPCVRRQLVGAAAGHGAVPDQRRASAFPGRADGSVRVSGEQRTSRASRKSRK